MDSKWQCLKIYHHINKSQHKLMHFTRHNTKRYTKTKNTRFTLMTTLLSDESLLTKQSIPFTLSLSLSLSLSLILSFGFCFFFLTPILHKLSVTIPWAFSLLNPPLISLSLQFYAVWVFLLQPQWEFHSFHGFSSYPLLHFSNLQ